MRLSLSFLLCCGFLLGSSLSWSACTQADPADEDPESIARRRYVEDIQSVEVSTATQGTFQRELISNGKLRASREATIGFRSTQEIQEVRVHNGQRVQKGDTLAVLDYFREQVAFEQTQQAVEGAELERKDVLMLQGYYIYKDSVEIPEEILRMANNKSGLLQAISERTLAQRKLEDAFVIAPFSGRIADLQAQAHNLASQYEFFCLLLDDRSFEVAFTILEGELARVQVGQDVTIIPMNVPINQTIGKVQSLNPRVDEDGMVQVMASVRNSRSGLLPGM
ncbi:MAG: HlyD family efflux transporter periplasmic adaptor subunit, partial [Bacteroidota bacterium]